MDSLLSNLEAAMPDLLRFVLYVAYTIGVLYVFDAILSSIKRSSDPRGVPGTRPVVALIIGGGLMSMGFIAGLAVNAVTADEWSVSSTYSYFGGTSSDNVHQQNMRTIVHLIMIGGYIGMIRGMMLWKAAGDGERGGHGLDSHVLSGGVMIFFSACAINLIGVLKGVSWLTKMPLPSFLT